MLRPVLCTASKDFTVTFSLLEIMSSVFIYLWLSILFMPSKLGWRVMPLAIDYTVPRGLQFKGFVYVETIEFWTSALFGIEGFLV